MASHSPTRAGARPAAARHPPSEVPIHGQHARAIRPFDYRHHCVVSSSLRAFLRCLDLRAKLDAQQEIRELCDLMWPHLMAWAPQFADWYEKSRLHKARLAP